MVLPRYRCHKEVGAFKIGGIARRDAVWVLTDAAVEDTIWVTVDQAWYTKHQPKIGGYYVAYDDGYASFSPAAPFESGYTRIEEPQ